MFKKIFNFKEYNFRHYHMSILLAAFLLSFIGLTIMEVVQEPEDRLYEKQIIGLVIGLIAAFCVSLADYHFVCKFYILFYIINMGLLLYTKFKGKSYHQAKRWIIIGGDNGITLMPSELTKVFLILFIAAMFARFYKKIDKFYFLVIMCILVAPPLYLVMEQPDLSTTIAMLVMFAGMVFLSGITYKIIIPVLAVAIPACIALWWYIQQDFQVLLHTYQQNRILALKNPDLYPDLMYQQNNAAIAIHSGGLAGKMMTDSTGATWKCKGLAAIESDFIYTAFAEAYGFIGCCVVIGLMAYFVFRAFQTARHARDYLGMLIAGGIGTLIGSQTFIHICVNTSLFPNTGIPLPYASSGLSSLLGNYLMVGLLLNIGLQTKKKEKEEDLVSL